MKPLAWRGDLCFGPNQGRNITFVNPSQWIGKWQPVEPYAALQEMARRYLRAYGLALCTTLEPMQSLEMSDSVNLLPFFDAYVMGIGRGAEIEPLLPMAYQSQVYRPQGWISAVVLVGGRIKGVWEAKIRGKQTIVRVPMFSSLTASIRKAIEAEAERLSAFLNTQAVPEYDD